MISHLIMAPVLLPLFAGLLILLEVRQRLWLRRATGLIATALLLPIAFLLWQQAAAGDITVYRLGNWQPPFGIVLVLDQLSAMMLLITALLALPVYLHACRGDDQPGANFHSLFQFQLLGINGAFLTGDLFNLFVFFEVLLIASYALLMHGQGPQRAKAGLHYVILNLAGSSLFLFGLGLLYAATGTLNMADVGRVICAGELVSPLLLQVSGALLLVVFALKAALLPLSFWLPGAYSAASAPVAALFAIMTKVGLYAIWRMWPLLYGLQDSPLHGMVSPWLWGLALATIAFAALGVLSAQRLAVLASWLVLVSVGTLMAALTASTPAAWAAGFYYMIHSTFAAAALFLLVGLISAHRGVLADQIEEGSGLSPLLGLLFVVLAVMLVGLPPLSGFIGKLVLLQAVPEAAFWIVLLLASLLLLIAFSRAGSTVFWRHQAGGKPATLPLAAAAPLTFLLLLCVAMVVLAAPMMNVAASTAEQLANAQGYIDAVLGAAEVMP
ncbi:monovalent cation/H+ antiporter subunit D [Alcanivorax sp. 1008]|uniref:monovalent cation/H+ antiporter subunit D n=1 Tax=Alcanivorax sp. 1008 TaxID=2816853 RepID=UPI001DBE97D5|nr:monovalent cation/H+ antiporter subunit D [Alcanivorax sp. 1008]MCC1496048.1 monovalent cation/H+ antiporter subunit D [Alcanivorax sp. 1008]